MKFCSFAFCGAVSVGALVIPETEKREKRTSQVDLLTDISQISRYWGQGTTYVDNPEDFFGVDAVGLPNGCQIEQVHTLQRHAQRLPTSSPSDGGLAEFFWNKLSNFTKASPKHNTSFTGPLEFLNTYTYVLANSGLLTGIGATTEFQAGVTFWNRYGRTLFNASQGQISYNATSVNGTTRREKPVLRTTGQSRIWNSEISWAAGFFGQTFEVTPNPEFLGLEGEFGSVVTPEEGSLNNTLASTVSCLSNNAADAGDFGDDDLLGYIPLYLAAATQRLQVFAPDGFVLTTNDTYAFQSICSYEVAYIGMSDFCNFFTADEWAGFENIHDIQGFYDYSYGSPAGRAQGIGYVQELLARLKDQYIPFSNTSVNSTLDDNPTTFPLNEPFYADFTHDDIIVSVLTALGFNFFNESASLTQVPPDPDRKFIISHLVPFGANLITEVIACGSPDPQPITYHRTQYSPTQYGYDPENSPYKFIRMRLNNGILPLNTLGNGACGNATTGRFDGLCQINSFLEAEKEAFELSNYAYACFANYTVDNAEDKGKNYDGTISAATV